MCFTNENKLMRFWTVQICPSMIRSPQRSQEKSCHVQVVVGPSFPLAGSACRRATIILLICLWHTRGSMMLQWLCCGSWPAALLCTFHLSTIPITDFSLLHCLLFLWPLELLPEEWEAHSPATQLGSIWSPSVSSLVRKDPCWLRLGRAIGAALCRERADVCAGGLL